MTAATDRPAVLKVRVRTHFEVITLFQGEIAKGWAPPSWNLALGVRNGALGNGALGNPYFPGKKFHWDLLPNRHGGTLTLQLCHSLFDVTSSHDNTSSFRGPQTNRHSQKVVPG